MTTQRYNTAVILRDKVAFSICDIERGFQAPLDVIL